MTELITRLHEQSWTHEGRPHLNRAPGKTGYAAPAGPWDSEPDKVQWIDAETDYDCLAVRNRMGAWCGYVGVPPGHPDHGKDYDDVDVDVHGSLTFAGSCQEDAPEGHGICHIPLDGRPDDVWWLGFDCGHAWDVIPTLITFYQDHDIQQGVPHFGAQGSYKDLAYVQEEVSILAMQLRLRA